MNKLINKLEGLVRWPKKPSDKEIVIKFLSTQFKSNIRYSEKEVNKVISQTHLFNDIPLLR